MTTPKRSSAIRPAWPRLSGRGLAASEIELGSISGIFGVKGEVRLHLHHRDSTLFKKERVATMVSLEGERFSVKVRSRVGAGRRVIGRIEGLSDRDVARALKGWVLAISRADLPEPQKGEFYVWAAEGLPIMADGAQVGSVVGVHETEVGDIFEALCGEDTIFIPLEEKFLLKVDVGEGGSVTLQPGIFETIK